MTPQLIRVDDSPGRTVYLHGDGRLIYPAIRAARSPRKYDVARRAVGIPRAHLDDVLAAIEMQNGGDVTVQRLVG